MNNFFRYDLYAVMSRIQESQNHFCDNFVCVLGEGGGRLSGWKINCSKLADFANFKRFVEALTAQASPLAMLMKWTGLELCEPAAFIQGLCLFYFYICSFIKKTNKQTNKQTWICVLKNIFTYTISFVIYRNVWNVIWNKGSNNNIIYHICGKQFTETSLFSLWVKCFWIERSSIILSASLSFLCLRYRWV